MDRYGETLDGIKTRRLVRVVLAIVVIGCGAAVYEAHSAKTAVVALRLPPWIFADEAGHAHAVDYQAVEFSPADTRFEGVIKAALKEFCRLQYTWKKGEYAADLKASEVFMEPSVATRFESQRPDQVAKFVKDSTAVEAEFEWVNTSLGGVKNCGEGNQAPCTGSTVDFRELGTGNVQRVCTAHIDFQFGRPDSEYKNPVGLEVEGWRVDCGGIEARNE